MIERLTRLPSVLFYVFGTVLCVFIALGLIYLPKNVEQGGRTHHIGLWRGYLVALMVLAISSFVLPTASQYVSNARARHRVEAEQARTTAAQQARIDRLLADAHDYNRSLPSDSYLRIGDPAAGNPARGTITQNHYDQLLSLDGEAVMGGLSIPAIGVQLPILHGTDPNALSGGAAHVYGTALPVGGESTHAVLTSHAGWSGRRLFTDLDRLAIGDSWTVTVAGEKLTYKVVARKVVVPTDLTSLKPQPGRDLMSLVTCTPVGVNSHRLIVTGERVS